MRSFVILAAFAGGNAALLPALPKDAIEAILSTELNYETEEEAHASMYNDSAAQEGCAAQLDCGSCTSTKSNIFASCRWCPKDGDNMCHEYGSVSGNSCSSEEQITDSDQCPVQPSSRKPFVILPGLIGSNIEAKLDKTSSPNLVCSKTSDWYTMWISSYEVAPKFCDCLFDNMRLDYLGGGDVKNPDGVSTRVPEGNSGMDGVTCLIPELCSQTKNWYDVIHALQAAGYVPGVDLFALPYDFRLGPKQYMEDAYPALKALIESAFQASGNQKVVLSSISMGGPFGHVFLTQYVDQAWKDQYIDSWISLSGVFNGAPMIVEELVSGMPMYGLTWIDQHALRDAMREWPSFSWLVPKSVGADDDRVIVYSFDTATNTSVNNYTLSEVPALLELAGADAAASMQSLFGSYTTQSDPGVKVHCWFTENMPTEFAYVIDANNIEADPLTKIYGLGDGTGDANSLAVCKNWESAVVETFDKICHSCFLTNATIVNRIVDMVTSA